MPCFAPDRAINLPVKAGFSEPDIINFQEPDITGEDGVAC